MERLTEKRGARVWLIYHLSWYLNLVLFLAAMTAVIYYLVKLNTGTSSEVSDTVMMMSFVTLAAILLMGAGISRYQARLEGQHLELRKAITALEEELKNARTEQVV